MSSATAAQIVHSLRWDRADSDHADSVHYTAANRKRDVLRPRD